MDHAGSLTADTRVFRRGAGIGMALALLMTVVISGTMPLISYLYRPLTWVVWGVVSFLILLTPRAFSIHSLLKPVSPYLLWLSCFIVWGLLVAQAPDLQLGIRLLVTTVIIATAMAIIVSDLTYLKYFANSVQWTVFINLMLIPMAYFSPRANSIIDRIFNIINGGPYDASRYAGLWGNPNMAGYICLIALILSVWSTPFIAWIGRFSAVVLIFLTASRKSMLLLLMLLILNAIIVQRHNLKRAFFMILTTVSVVLLLLLSGGLLRKSQSSIANSKTIARLMDITETDTALAGGETRMSLLRHWLPYAATAPWYGYGFGAMIGENDEARTTIRKHLYPNGTHNTYLGIFIEVGPVGLFAFLLILIYYARNYWKFRGNIYVRWALISFLACNYIILFMSHTHLFTSFEGNALFMLFFLLPTSQALRRHEFVE